MDSELTPSPLARLFQMVNQYRLPQAIFVAAQLGLADMLADGSKSVAELARATGTHPPTLALLLRLLVSAEVFGQQPDGRFRLTPLSSYLRTDAPDSWRDWVISLGHTAYPVWGNLLYTVQTGQAAFEQTFGSSYYSYMAQHPEIAAAWDRSMEQSSRDWPAALPTRYDFTPFRRVVDVGGGHGTVLAALLKAIPPLSGVLFDLPHVVVGAYDLVQQFAQMVRTRTGEHLDAWLVQVVDSQIPELQSFTLGIERDKPAVVAGLTLPHSNDYVA